MYSHLGLAGVVQESSLGLSIVENEVGDGIGGGHRGDSEGDHVHGVLVDTEKASVVPPEGHQEADTSGGKDDSGLLLVDDEARVVLVELVWAGVHFSFFSLSINKL